MNTLYIASGTPWENGYVGSFNSRLRDELPNRELFLSIDEFRYVADRWRMDYNNYSGRPSLPDIAAWTIWHRQHWRRCVLSKAPLYSRQEE
ncbi:MAG TPA: integrase core domain-containing protein [Sedimentisphaerales bacterium]|nr:integrase core domain-containing protein [Sedimentisphaerales bacterium]